MKDTKIQWTDHTWNIAVGCKKVDADCKYCYMYRGSLNGARYDPREIRKTKTVFNLPLKIKEPARIFVSSLTDVFLEEIDGFRHEMWNIIRQCPQHTFQILTKRPERIKQCLPPDWGEGWDNVWLGTSVGSQDAANERIPHLLLIPAAIHFLSIEPLHGFVDLMNIEANGSCFGFDLAKNVMRMKVLHPDFSDFPNAIDWVIVGGESGNENGKYLYRPCEISWIENIVQACKENNVPVFVKQLGTHLSKELGLKDRHGGNAEEWPEDLKIREFPLKNG